MRVMLATLTPENPAGFRKKIGHLLWGGSDLSRIVFVILIGGPD